jgi:hypothetical protein
LTGTAKSEAFNGIWFVMLATRYRLLTAGRANARLDKGNRFWIDQASFGNGPV